MKPKLKFLDLMTIVTFGLWREKRASLRMPSQMRNFGAVHHVSGLSCCIRDWCTSQNRRHHEERLCGNTEALSQNVTQSLGAKGFSKWTVMQSRRPAWLQSNFRTTKSVFLEWPSQSLNPMGRAEKQSVNKGASKLGSVAPDLSGGKGPGSCKLLWEACWSTSKMLDPSHTV